MAYCSQSRAARSTCSTLEEPISDISDQRISQVWLCDFNGDCKSEDLAREASLCWVNQSMIQVELRGLHVIHLIRTLIAQQTHFSFSYSFFASIRTGISPS